MKTLKLCLSVLFLTLFMSGCSSEDSLSDLYQTRWEGEMVDGNNKYKINIFFVKEKSGHATRVNVSNPDDHDKVLFLYEKEGNVLIFKPNASYILTGAWYIQKLNSKELIFDQKEESIKIVKLRRDE